VFGTMSSNFCLVINRRSMAIFNKREVGYIKAIAGVGDHKTIKHSRATGDLSNHALLTITNSRVDDSDKRMKALMCFLHKAPQVVDASDVDPDFNNWDVASEKSSAGFHPTVFSPQLNCLDVTGVPEGNEGKVVPTDQRVGEDFYLNSTFVKMRFTMPDFGALPTDGSVQPHHEYRLIIFRNRKPQVGSRDAEGVAMDGVTFQNFHYDLFNGYVGRRIGLQGYRKHEVFDNSELYSGNVRSGTLFTSTGGTDKSPPTEPANLTPDDWMTLPLNDTDYVIHTDERFFMGREHGKSHYEKIVSFDWSERGSTNADDMQDGLREGFNPNWVMMLLATTNDNVAPNVNYHITQVTSVESA